MSLNILAIFFTGFIVGLLSALFLIRYGFNLGAKALYEQKESIPPGGDKAVPFEQALTEAEPFEEEGKSI